MQKTLFLIFAATLAFLSLKTSVLAQRDKATKDVENLASLKETLDWMKTQLDSNVVLVKATLPPNAAVGEMKYESDGTSNANFHTASEAKLSAFTYQPQQFDACTISWKQNLVTNMIQRLEMPQAFVFRIYGSKAQSTIMTVSLSDLDPFSVKVVEGNFNYTAVQLTAKFPLLEFRTTNNKKAITTRYIQCIETDNGLEKVVSCEPDDSGVKGYINFSDKELAERFARAMKHAVQLCGGKVAPF